MSKKTKIRQGSRLLNLKKVQECEIVSFTKDELENATQNAIKKYYPVLKALSSV